MTRSVSRLWGGVAALALLAAASTLDVKPAAAQSDDAAAADGEKYTIYLSNNFVGNDWRQQMLRVAELSAGKEPLASRVELHIENSETTPQAQIASLNNIIRAQPDAILIDSGSPTALNPTIERACAAGIVVITFDQGATADCAYRLTSDWNRIPRILAEWMAETLGGEGKIFVDRGLAGAPISEQLQSGYEEVLKEYPGIEIIGYYNGDYALGPEQAGVASLLAAHPEVDGILTQGYGTGALKALSDAGRPIVPVTGFSYNATAVECAQTEGAACILGSNPAYLSAEAIRLAVDILDGKVPDTHDILINGAVLTTGPFTSKLFPDAEVQQITVGETAFPDLAPGLTLPISPDWMEITAEEAAGS